MKRVVYFIIPGMFFLWTCEPDPLKVDTEIIQVSEFETKRMENDLFALNEKNFSRQFEVLKQDYGIVFDHFLMNPFRLNGSADTNCRKELLRFVNDSDIRGSYAEIRAAFPDTEFLEQGFSDIRKRFHYHFPTKALPKQLVTTITGWNYAVAYMDSTLLLSLDMYLGENSKYYQMLHYPAYQTRKMNRAHIMSDIARAWLLTEFDNAKTENTLLHHTIFYGKLFYCVKALTPNEPDSVIIGYSASQMATCKKYEKQYWSYCAEKNRLYENSLQIVRELTSEGPFTAAISKECPPRIAMWLGWRIVESYMKNNKVTLEQLMKEKDPQKILSKSRYRP